MSLYFDKLLLCVNYKLFVRAIVGEFVSRSQPRSHLHTKQDWSLARHHDHLTNEVLVIYF